MMQKLELLDSAFSPTAPISSQEFFLGRIEQAQRAVEAINRRGQHLVVYGERGVGKTSFANILATKITNLIVSKVTCSRDENFEELWRKALSRVTVATPQRGIGFTSQPSQESEQLDLFLPDKDRIDSIDVQVALERASGNLLFIFDEFDSISASDVRIRFADTIKGLSDNAPRVTIAIVGIAETVSDLIGHHPSLERCIRQVPMPRMSATELRQIVEKGMDVLKMAAEESVVSRIVSSSSGFPHFTHLLGLYSARAAIESSSQVVMIHHYQTALAKAIEDTQQSIRVLYQQAIASGGGKATSERLAKLLFVCAEAQVDEFGTFLGKDIVSPFNRVAGESSRAQEVGQLLQRFCDPERGAVLTKVVEGRHPRYRFVNPMLRVFIRLKYDQAGVPTPGLFLS